MRRVADVLRVRGLASMNPREVIAMAREMAGRTGPAGTPCTLCAGDGWTGPSDTPEYCERCRGNGVEPTAAPVCQRCNGVGYVAPDVPMGHPEFGRAHQCGQCQGSRIGRQGPDDVLAKAKVPAEYRRYTLASFDKAFDGPGQVEALLRAGELAHDPQAFRTRHGKPGLALMGPPGVGKTGLAIATLAELATKVDRVRFVSWPWYVDQLFRAYKGELIMSADQLATTIGGYHVLVIDEFGRTGREQPEPVQRAAHDLWEARYRHGLAGSVTLVTSHLTEGQIEAEFGALGKPILSRIHGCCLVQDMAGDDLRETSTMALVAAAESLVMA